MIAQNGPINAEFLCHGSSRLSFRQVIVLPFSKYADIDEHKPAFLLPWAHLLQEAPWRVQHQPLTLASRCALADANPRGFMKIIHTAEHPMLSTAEPIKLSQPTTSHQLGALGKTGLAINTPESLQHVFAANSEGFAAVRSYLDGVWPGQHAAVNVAEARTSPLEHRKPSSCSRTRILAHALSFALGFARSSTVWLCSHLGAVPAGLAMAGTGGELGAVLDTPCQNRKDTSSLRRRKNGRIR